MFLFYRYVLYLCMRLGGSANFYVLAAKVLNNLEVVQKGDDNNITE